jgi:hypothetical protein
MVHLSDINKSSLEFEFSLFICVLDDPRGSEH